MFIKNNSKKSAFTLAEAMIFLLVATLIIVAAMPVITRKHNQPVRLPHGKWACVEENGKRYTTILGDSTVALPPLDDKNSWKECPITGCKFPRLPESVKSIMVRVIGGGAAGGDAVVKKVENNTNYPMFTDCESSPQNNPKGRNKDFKITQTGVYDITLYGARGQAPTLTPRTMRIDIEHAARHVCEFQQPEANKRVPYVQFTMTLNKDDVLSLEYPDEDGDGEHDRAYIYEFKRHAENKLCEGEHCNENWLSAHPYYYMTINGTEITPYHFCNGFIDGIINNNGKNQPYYFLTEDPHWKEEKVGVRSPLVHRPGNGGYTKIFKLNGTELVKITGGGGAYYESAVGRCSYTGDATCKDRFTLRNDHDPYDGDAKKAVTFLSNESNISNIKYSFTDNASQSFIHPQTGTLKLIGGKGGAAGEAISEFMLPPKHDIKIEIGHGGVTAGESGTDTVFGSMRAHGGLGFAPESEIAGVGYGQNGAVPALLFDGDAVAGKGGWGFLLHGVSIDNHGKEPTKQDGYIQTEACDGGNAPGIGAGGGGSGVGVVFIGWSDNEINPAIHDFETPDVGNPNKKLYLYRGKPGQGASGGVVVTW